VLLALAAAAVIGCGDPGRNVAAAVAGFLGAAALSPQWFEVSLRHGAELLTATIGRASFACLSGEATLSADPLVITPEPLPALEGFARLNGDGSSPAPSGLFMKGSASGEGTGFANKKGEEAALSGWHGRGVVLAGACRSGVGSPDNAPPTVLGALSMKGFLGACRNGDGPSCVEQAWLGPSPASQEEQAGPS